MDVVVTFERVLDQANEVVDRVEPSQLGNPTPCAEWDVRAVINHIAGGATMFAECVEQGSVPDSRLGELMAGDNLGDDFKANYRAASDRARATFAMPGALDKMVEAPVRRDAGWRRLEHRDHGRDDTRRRYCQGDGPNHR